MRRVILALLILILPSATAVVVYFIVTKRVPTNREAIGHVATIAGAGFPGVEDGPARSASFSDPFSIAVDRRGNLYIADGGQSNRIRRIKPDGNVDTIAGSSEGFADGGAFQAQFNTPSGIVIDRKGNIIVADTSNNRIRKLAADGKVTTLAGSGAAGYRDGLASDAEFDGPIGLAVDPQGNVFVADAYNDRIRKISTDGNVTTIAGTGAPGFSDGQAASAAFDTPSGLAVDNDGNIFVADTGNHAVRKITPQGEAVTIAGKSNGLNHPVGIVVTHDGFVFVSCEGSGRIVRIAPEGQTENYAGSSLGFADGDGDDARFNGPAGIAIDREGNLFIADSQNFTIRQVSPLISNHAVVDHKPEALFIQPPEEQDGSPAHAVIPKLSAAELAANQTFPWPLAPQDQWHEIAGVAGEARGAPGGVALDHLHSGLDIHGSAGDAALSVYDEKVSSPIANWDFGGAGEGIHVGLFSYIHIRVGRNAEEEIQAAEKFKPRIDSIGTLASVRVRRGTRFRVGDFIGSLNRLNHVHLTFGPWNAQSNPLALPFFGFKDTVAPTIEKIEVVAASGSAASTPPFEEQRNGRLVVSGDVTILVTAFDRVDGNLPNRKLGLYRIGYQLLNANGTPVTRFEQPLMNIEFNRLPPEGSSVRKVYAPGSGVSAYGTPTKFRYIVTNRVRDGEASDGLLRTSGLAPGNYIIKVIAEDYAGNRASGPSTQLAIIVRN